MADGNGWIPTILVVLLVFLQTQRAPCSGEDLPVREVGGAGNETSLAEQVIGALYDCRLHYAQLPESFTRLSVYHLVLGRRNEGDKFGASAGELKKLDFNVGSKNGSKLQLNLNKLNLDPQLPFIFFTNGFNHNGILDGTWMEAVAKVYLSRYLTAHHHGNVGLNVIFLNWHMEGLLANNAMSMIPVYYRTMANYDIIVSRFQSAIEQIVDHLDGLRSELEGSLQESHHDYYGKFSFYGHSLGSHILAHALVGVHKLRPDLRFGRIYGLDPAVPCFLNNQSGLTASRASGVAREVVVLHSNAGILGTSSDRGQLEIVLNGGTFQPNCSFYDLICHHVRSTQVFGYIDDSCKMVAYKCNKYEQFKLGACETCDSSAAVTGRTKNSSFMGTPNCVLVNLEEQNEDNQLIESISLTEQVRQLADDEYEYNFERAAAVGRKLAAREPSYLRNARPEYHFVDTNSKFMESATKSHCLQHYQLRLLTLDDGGQSACPLRLLHGDEISVQLFQEPSYLNEVLSRNEQDQIPGFKLTTIVDDQLHTGLGTFGGRPRLFVGAVIDNIDLTSLSECLLDGQQNSSAAMELVLDIAFMSHTRKSVRHAFSSVLCARWPNQTTVTTTNRDGLAAPAHLMLSLCRQSELTNVSNRIDQLLSQVKFHNQFQPWHVILLNNLFSLFSGWDPL